MYRQTERLKDKRKIERPTKIIKDRQKDVGKTEGFTARHKDRKTGRKIERQTDGLKERQKDCKTDRTLPDRQKE